ncbi:MAG: hypothetical protein M2R45_00135 [Verrucomicrobia subdivision 3 bacterium]|nr:hypothetical protein [Limisphaerales bacterium]MCS1412405.1 hypothetical protein [Limisphaerales bacterium]
MFPFKRGVEPLSSAVGPRLEAERSSAKRETVKMVVMQGVDFQKEIGSPLNPAHIVEKPQISGERASVASEKDS